MNTKTKFGIIWDQTGVLYKYGRDNVTKAFKQVLNNHNVDFSEEIFSEKYKGTSLDNQFKMWKKDFGLEIPIPIKQFSEEATKIQLEMLTNEKEKEYDETLFNLLKELKEVNIPMIMVTSSWKYRAERIHSILGYDNFIPEIISAEDVENHEPSTDALDIAIKRLGLRAEQCIVIEDAASGIKAAKLAGCKTIGYSVYGENQYNSLKSSRPDALITDFSQISYSTLKEIVLEKEGFIDSL